MKNFILTISSILLFGIVVLAFVFLVPEDGNLISEQGDTFLGLGLTIFFLVNLISDIVRYKKSKIQNSNK
jgi:hypothetical protein